jgi:peptidoglycan-associated lipoprotein
LSLKFTNQIISVISANSIINISITIFRKQNMKQQLKSFLSAATLAVALTATLMGCSSGVKLDVPVEDKTGISTTGTGSGNAANNGLSNNGVATVDLGAGGTGANGGPANVGKVIYFDFDSYLVKPEYASVINAHVQFLASRKTSKISVEGHTDSSGGREYNLALGQKRAEAVRRAMALSGLNESQIEAVSFGKEKPADLGGDDAAAAKNRRAEISYR